MFELSKEQWDRVGEWIKKHNVEKHGSEHPYMGAIGGAFTYEFTPTSLGTVNIVRCACKDKIDVSDYDSW